MQLEKQQTINRKINMNTKQLIGYRWLDINIKAQTCVHSVRNTKKIYDGTTR